MSNQRDHVRDLNNLLQEQTQNLTQFLTCTNWKTGPNHQAWHTVQYSFRGRVVGVGEGPSINQAKHNAAMQALIFFDANPPR